jgi:hypothetical protein
MFHLKIKIDIVKDKLCFIVLVLSLNSLPLNNPELFLSGCEGEYIIRRNYG